MRNIFSLATSAFLIFACNNALLASADEPKEANSTNKGDWEPSKLELDDFK